jgi:hypothetical protein
MNLFYSVRLHQKVILPIDINTTVVYFYSIKISNLIQMLPNVFLEILQLMK